MLRMLTIILLLLISPLGVAEPVALRFLISEAWSMPYGEIVNEGGQVRLTRGILKDWQEALAAELGYQAQIVALPKNRIVKGGYSQEYDLQCFIAPEWLGGSAKNLDWLPAYDHIEERLVGPAGTRDIVRGEQLRNKRIGTVRGYFYPKLDPFFKNTNTHRDDATDEAGLLRKQLAGRVDYSVMRVVDLQYEHVVHPATNSLELSGWVVTSTPVHCARSRSSSIPFDSLSKAQERLLKAGKYNAIVKRYIQ